MGQWYARSEFPLLEWRQGREMETLGVISLLREGQFAQAGRRGRPNLSIVEVRGYLLWVGLSNGMNVGTSRVTGGTGILTLLIS